MDARVTAQMTTAPAVCGVVLLLLAGHALLPGQAFAQCTVQERIELGRQGYSRDDVDRLCGSPVQQTRPPAPAPGGGGPASPQRPRLTSTCVTTRGVCQTVTPVPAGDPCTCVFPTGAFPGVAR